MFFLSGVISEGEAGIRSGSLENQQLSKVVFTSGTTWALKDERVVSVVTSAQLHLKILIMFLMVTMSNFVFR